MQNRNFIAAVGLNDQLVEAPLWEIDLGRRQGKWAALTLPFDLFTSKHVKEELFRPSLGATSLGETPSSYHVWAKRTSSEDNFFQPAEILPLGIVRFTPPVTAGIIAERALRQTRRKEQV